VSASTGTIRRERFVFHLDEGLVDAHGAGVEVEVGPGEGQQLAASQPVQDGQAERRRPAMRGGDIEEPGDLLLVPSVHVTLAIGAGHLARHRHPGGRVAAQQAFLDGVVEYRPQDRATDLNAPARQLAALSEIVQPAGHVVAVQQVNAHATQAGLDVGGRPGVLLSGLGADVGARRHPAVHQPPHSAPLDLRAAALGQQRGHRPLRRSPRRVRPDLAGTGLPRGGIDPIDPHHPLAALPADRWIRRRSPCHRGPPRVRPCRSVAASWLIHR
jgi:hypothetical protein